MNTTHAILRKRTIQISLWVLGLIVSVAYFSTVNKNKIEAEKQQTELEKLLKSNPKFAAIYTAFDNAQQTQLTDSAANIIVKMHKESSLKHQKQLAQLIASANCQTIDLFLTKINFIDKTNKLLTSFNFDSLKNINSNNLETLKSKNMNCYTPEEQNVLKNSIAIAGAIHPNKQVRNSFINQSILKNESNAISQLHFFSNIIKLSPDEPTYQNAFANTILLAKSETIFGFLKSSGFSSFNQKTDEYTNYDGAKLQHLSSITTKAIIKRLKENRQPMFKEMVSDKKKIISELEKLETDTQ